MLCNFKSRVIRLGVESSEGTRSLTLGYNAAKITSYTLTFAQETRNQLTLLDVWFMCDKNVIYSAFTICLQLAVHKEEEEENVGNTPQNVKMSAPHSKWTGYNYIKRQYVILDTATAQQVGVAN